MVSEPQIVSSESADAPSTMALDTSPDAATQELESFASISTKTFDKAELHRQIDYYFSEENLRKDAHLLGKLEEGNGTVSIAQITGWSRMRKFRPLSAVKDALKESTVIELVDNKRIRLRQPFDMTKALVKPRINEEERKLQQAAILKANPHLTKAMLKRTGFEHDHIEPGLTFEEQQTELEQYSTELPITVRLETAVLKYKMNRKFHQESFRVFHAFLNYGGFDERPANFTGGMSKEEEEGLSKDEKATRKQVHYVSDEAMQSLEEGDGRWVVDFEGVTKGFFSTVFAGQFLWHDDIEHDMGATHAACNVLRNFFNYLLYHNVCAEYVEQINSARDVLVVIEDEFVKLADAQKSFPGTFSIACSVLTDGYYSKTSCQGDWMAAEQVATYKTGYSNQEARSVVNAGIAGYGSHRNLASALSNPVMQAVSEEEDVGLEVTTIIHLAEAAEWTQGFFEKLKGSAVEPMGKLVCKRIHFQKAAPLDLPPNLRASAQTFDFLIDEETLQKCYPGMKFVADVKKISSGFWFVDRWSECHGTFYTWCWNERARDYRETVDALKLAKPKYRASHELGDETPKVCFASAPKLPISPDIMHLLQKITGSLDLNDSAQAQGFNRLDDKSEETKPERETTADGEGDIVVEPAIVVHAPRDEVARSMGPAKPADTSKLASSQFEKSGTAVDDDDGFLSDEEFAE